MSFRENLLKKIRIKSLGGNILRSMGPVDSGKRTDIKTLRELLDMSPYPIIKNVTWIYTYKRPMEKNTTSLFWEMICPCI